MDRRFGEAKVESDRRFADAKAHADASHAATQEQIKEFKAANREDHAAIVARLETLESRIYEVTRSLADARERVARVEGERASA